MTEATVHSQPGPDPSGAGRLDGLRQKALECIEKALAATPGDRPQWISQGEVALVQLRDQLIARQRAAGEAALSANATLTQANQALSLVVGLEFPAGAVQRGPLEQACDLLRSMRV